MTIIEWWNTCKKTSENKQVYYWLHGRKNEISRGHFFNQQGSDIRDVQNLPGWGEWVKSTNVENSVAKKKERLLALPIGTKRPHGSTPMGSDLCCYISKFRSCYDKEFDKKIRARFPEWWRADYNKNQLLKLPLGSKKPYFKTVLGSALFCYVSKKKECHDPEFTRKIQARFPQWFLKSCSVFKKKLLSLPKYSNKSRPKDNPILYSALLRYTKKNSCCYDSEFDKKIRARFPDWWPDVDVVLNKKERLLAMPLGSKKPIYKINRSFYHYIDKKSVCYDSGFDKKIRARFPEWFKR